MGMVPLPSGALLPAGLSFVGPAWSEARLLGLAYAFEQRRGLLPLPAYRRHSTA
jgi:amidase